MNAAFLWKWKSLSGVDSYFLNTYASIATIKAQKIIFFFSDKWNAALLSSLRWDRCGPAPAVYSWAAPSFSIITRRKTGSCERWENVNLGVCPSAADMRGASAAFLPSPATRSHHADPRQSSRDRRVLRSFSTFVLLGGQRRRRSAAEGSWRGLGGGRRGGRRILPVAVRVWRQRGWKVCGEREVGERARAQVRSLGVFRRPLTVVWRQQLWSDSCLQQKNRHALRWIVIYNPIFSERQSFNPVKIIGRVHWRI